MTAPTEQASPKGQEQRASWLELFFDLVVVVTVAVLAERLAERQDLTTVALVLELYLAIWLVWVSFMLYANVAGDRTHQRSMVLAMACIAVMAASIPAIHPHGDGLLGPAGSDGLDRSRAFAVAYVIARVLAMGVWRTTSRALIDWPIAQLSVGLTPWIGSIFLPGNARYWAWALGLLLDIGFAVMADDPDRVLHMLRRDRRADDERAARRAAKRAGRRGYAPASEITAVGVNLPHFEERLGIFVIIVLGEAVSQVVRAAGGRAFDHRLGLAAAAAFTLLVGLWWLTFQYGFAASPESRLARMPARFGLPVQFLTTAAVIFLATGLGQAVQSPSARLPAGPRWLAAGGLAAYFLVTALGAVSVGAGWVWLCGWALPSVLVPLVVGIAGGPLAGWGVAGLLLTAVVWQASYGWLRQQEVDR